MRTYDLFGLVVQSELPLENARPCDGPADVVLTLVGERQVSQDVPDGELIARREVDQVLLSTFVRAPNGTVILRFHGVADFVLDLASGQIECARDPAADVALLPILSTGMVLTTYLQLQGELVLHATAVHLPLLEGAVALLGSSGMGKSTVATLLAQAGGFLVSDDVLRIDQVEGALMTRRGATEARLRPKARSLASGTSGSRLTVDGRLALTLPFAQADQPLRAVVIPGPSKEAETVSLQRLEPRAALLSVLSHPRILGWVDARSTERQFLRTAHLVGTVPVFDSVLPWGPPFDPNLGSELALALQRQLE